MSKQFGAQPFFGQIDETNALQRRVKFVEQPNSHSGSPVAARKSIPSEALLSGIIQENRARSIQNKLLELDNEFYQTQSSLSKKLEKGPLDHLKDLTVNEQVKKGAMDINNIEMWINKTLKESDIINAAGEKLKKNGANSMADYGVDRQSLE